MKFTKEKNRLTFILKTFPRRIHKNNLKLGNKKVSQNSNIPTEIINENDDIFAEYLCSNVSGLIKSSTFSSYLKVEDIAPVHKKDKKQITDKKI